MIWTLRDTWAITRRDMTRWVAQPVTIVAELAYPITFVLLFAYVFGSAMTVPGGGDYQEFLMPGMFVQTMAFGIGGTMAAVSADVENGITDRFRAMPMSRVAVVGGRSVADMLNSTVSLTIMLGCGLAVGWAPQAGVPSALAAVGLLLLLRFACLWVGIVLGLMVRGPEAIGAVWSLLFPLTMVTSAFVAPELMPGWLGFLAEWNPLSATVTATRELFGNPVGGGDSWVTEHAVLMAVVWPIVLVAVFLPLAVRRYHRLST
ncbi:MAG TPA: ABC transporter permease [Solirubrobacteraceae bacterium]|nr:ABC transporter permease [Solirubrobacteraceae bacterium]